MGTAHTGRVCTIGSANSGRNNLNIQGFLLAGADSGKKKVWELKYRYFRSTVQACTEVPVVFRRCDQSWL